MVASKAGRGKSEYRQTADEGKMERKSPYSDSRSSRPSVKDRRHVPRTPLGTTGPAWSQWKLSPVTLFSVALHILMDLTIQYGSIIHQTAETHLELFLTFSLNHLSAN